MRNNVLFQNGVKYILYILAGVALALTTINVNSSCWYISHQDDLPEGAKKFRKF